MQIHFVIYAAANPALIITGDTSRESINQIVGQLKILHSPLDTDVLENLLRELP